MTSESLVATGRPYGERQKLKAGMQQAGLPLAPVPTRPSLPTPTSAGMAPQPGTGPIGGLALIDGHAPDDFPFLADAPPPAAAGATGSVMSALGASAQSTFAQAVIARLAGG